MAPALPFRKFMVRVSDGLFKSLHIEYKFMQFLIKFRIIINTY